jgi:hypothetical protein
MSLMEEESLDVFHFDGGTWLPLDGIVDTDLNTITATTMGFSPFAVGTVPIPEPSTVVLAAIGLALVGLRRRRRLAP